MWTNKDDNLTYNGDFSFFYYQGSLTIPQCQENVHWFVVADPLFLGKAYLTMLKSALTDLPEVFTIINYIHIYINNINIIPLLLN